MRPLSFSLSLVLSAFLLARPAAAAITLQGTDATGYVFHAVVKVYDPLAPSDPENGVSLADLTHPKITNDVLHHAIFEFDMQGANGETFKFTLESSDPDDPFNDSQHLSRHFEAHGDMGSLFDVYCDASYLDAGGNVARPFFDVDDPNSVEPADSIMIIYQIKEDENDNDPPFTIGIFALNPQGGPTAAQPVVFTVAAAVPEPTSFTLFLGSLLAFATPALRRRFACPK